MINYRDPVTNQTFLDPTSNGMALVGQLGNTAKPLPRGFPIARCPSDGFETSNVALTNYMGSMGPQCTPFNCGTDFALANCNRPDWGCTTSASYGDTNNASQTRGLFNRGGAVIRMASVTDGLSNTMMVGETLPELYEGMRYGPGTAANTTGGGWADAYGGTSYGTTTVPLNWKTSNVTTGTSYSSCSANCPGVDPNKCLWNWGATWGFKSNHTGGANFVFCDGSVQFLKDSIDAKTYNQLGCRNDGGVTTW